MQPSSDARPISTRTRTLVKAEAGLLVAVYAGLLLAGWIIWRAPDVDPRDSMHPPLGPPYPIEPATFDRIRLGMTKKEVEEAIGEPSGAYEYEGAEPPRWGTLEVGYRPVMREAGLHYNDIWDGQQQKFKLTCWDGREFWIEVAFDENEKVIGYYLEKPRSDWWR